jgi:hypothetical protein
MWVVLSPAHIASRVLWTPKYFSLSQNTEARVRSTRVALRHTDVFDAGSTPAEFSRAEKETGELRLGFIRQEEHAAE